MGSCREDGSQTLLGPAQEDERQPANKFQQWEIGATCKEKVFFLPGRCLTLRRFPSQEIFRTWQKMVLVTLQSLLALLWEGWWSGCLPVDFSNLNFTPFFLPINYPLAFSFCRCSQDILISGPWYSREIQLLGHYSEWTEEESFVRSHPPWPASWSCDKLIHPFILAPKWLAKTDLRPEKHRSGLSVTEDQVTEKELREGAGQAFENLFQVCSHVGYTSLGLCCSHPLGDWRVFLVKSTDCSADVQRASHTVLISCCRQCVGLHVQKPLKVFCALSIPTWIKLSWPHMKPICTLLCFIQCLLLPSLTLSPDAGSCQCLSGSRTYFTWQSPCRCRQGAFAKPISQFFFLFLLLHALLLNNFTFPWMLSVPDSAMILHVIVWGSQNVLKKLLCVLPCVGKHI